MGMGEFPHFGEVARRVFKILFPPACPLCLATLPAGTAELFCSTCGSGIRPLTGACCSRCSLPFGGAENSSHLCARCLTSSPSFHHVYAYGYYAETLRQAVHQFKFNNKVGLDRCLATLIDQALGADLSVDLVVPVPLQHKNLCQRSYNQALLLAREIARIRGWKVNHQLLEKIRMTAPQHDLSARKRELNLRGAFEFRQRLSGEHVLLVDDVMTTGTTVEACCRVLLAAGAGQVDVAVIARAARS